MCLVTLGCLSGELCGSLVMSGLECAKTAEIEAPAVTANPSSGMHCSCQGVPLVENVPLAEAAPASADSAKKGACTTMMARFLTPLLAANLPAVQKALHTDAVATIPSV